MANDAEDDINSGQIKVSETIKKIITTGLGAAFMTEESIRAYLGELKLPKDALNYILQGASKSKEELLDRVGGEMVKLLSKIDFVSEAAKFVETHKFRVNAEIEVIKKESDRQKS